MTAEPLFEGLKGCTKELHEQHGGACYYCCETCNYDRHVCHFCGDPLKHNERFLSSGEVNSCYQKCECGHIGHEHYRVGCDRDGCLCTEWRPVAPVVEKGE